MSRSPVLALFSGMKIEPTMTNSTNKDADCADQRQAVFAKPAPDQLTGSQRLCGLSSFSIKIKDGGGGSIG